jgi:GT2 family glycosyltransferase
LSGTGGAESALATIVVTQRESYSSTQASLESILATTRQPFELIYIDAGSPRATRRWLVTQAVHRRFELVRVECHLAPNEARNLGLARAHTRYVMFVDNDVVVAPGWLDAAVACAEATDAWAVCPVYCIGEPAHETVHTLGGVLEVSGDPGRRVFRDAHFHDGEPLGQALVGCSRSPAGMVEFHALLVRRDVFDRIGTLDERLLATPEQHDLCLRIWEAGGTVWLEPDSVVTYLNRPPRLSDLPWFVLRWSSAWCEASLQRFQTTWGLRSDGAGWADHRAFLEHQRRRWYHGAHLWKARGLAARLGGSRGVEHFDRMADALIARPLAGIGDRRRTSAGRRRPGEV